MSNWWEKKSVAEIAITQVKEAGTRSRKWIRNNPWAFLFLLIGLVAFLWVLIRTLLLDNMGFQGKTFWQWMDLLLVPAMLALAGFWFSKVQKQTELEIARRERKADRKRARDQQRQSTLSAYLDKMTELILERGLGPDAEPEVKRLARTRTIIALLSLDAERNRQVMKFLQESQLLYPDPVVDLREAGLRGVELFEADLRRVNLSRADLISAKLAGADLRGANLSRTNLSGGADLRRAKLNGADLSEAEMVSAELEGAFLDGANLKGTGLVIADLSESGLIGADLSGANLLGADLSGALLSSSGLSDATLAEFGIEPGEANLSGANLEGANLKNARVITDQLLQADSLEDATMPDGTKYEEWIKRQETEKGEVQEAGS